MDLKRLIAHEASHCGGSRSLAAIVRSHKDRFVWFNINTDVFQTTKVFDSDVLYSRFSVTPISMETALHFLKYIP